MTTNYKLMLGVLIGMVIGIAGDPKNGHPCYSYFTCGTPLASDAGNAPLKGKRDFEKAKQLVKSMSPTRRPFSNTEQKFRRRSRLSTDTMSFGVARLCQSKEIPRHSAL